MTLVQLAILQSTLLISACLEPDAQQQNPVAETAASSKTSETKAQEPIADAAPAGDTQARKLPTASEIADRARNAYMSRKELAFDFTVSQVQDNGTWTYKGTARYSGRRSRVEMTEVEGSHQGRRLRFTCDVNGNQSIFTEAVDGRCRTFSGALDTFADKNWHPEINGVCIFAGVLKSWAGGQSRWTTMWSERVSPGETITEEMITDAHGNRHSCYVVMNGVEGSYEIFYIDKNSYLVHRWWVDRTSISRDSRYTYREPAPVGPDTFRIECAAQTEEQTDETAHAENVP